VDIGVKRSEGAAVLCYTYISYPVNFRLDVSEWDITFVLMRSRFCIFFQRWGWH